MIKIKKAQEEIAGFALIIVIIAVIILVFLSLFLMGGNQREIESYELNSFLDSMLECTTECYDNYGFPISIRKLIRECNNNKDCANNKHSCEVLEDTLEEITKAGWKIEEGGQIKGYLMNITSQSGEEIYSNREGNITGNMRTGFQDISVAQIKLELYS